MIVALAVVSSGPASADDLIDRADFVPDRATLRAGTEVGEDSQSLALDAYYDLDARARVGLTTSSAARYELGAIRGLCLHSCATGFAGLAAETEIRAADHIIGRAALDTARFAPTAAALELGFAAHYPFARWDLVVAPVLRLGIARRDLANGDALSTFARIAARVWSHAGALAETRGAVDIDALRATPTLGAAGGVYVDLGPITLTAVFGSSNVAHSRSLFGELALGWSS
jgi:hypothetical protein